MIGTSAGSMVAAHLRVGTDEGDAFARIREGAPLASYGRLGTSDAARYLRAQLNLDKRRGRALVGQAALSARTTTEEDWLQAIGLGLVGKPWPEGRLFITAVDAQTGTSVVFDNTSGVPLERAVAASCAVPGVFPAVEVGGRRYVDGGLRSIANADLAAGHQRVLVLSPFPIGSRLRDLPPVQLLSSSPRPGPTSSCRTPRTCGRWVPTRSTCRAAPTASRRPAPMAPVSPTGSARCGPTDPEQVGRRARSAAAPRVSAQPAPGLLTGEATYPGGPLPVGGPHGHARRPAVVKLPSSWPLPVVATLCMAALAALDLFGAFAAKEWARSRTPSHSAWARCRSSCSSGSTRRRCSTRSWPWSPWAGSCCCRSASSSSTASHFDSSLPAGKLAAVVVILAAQGYLLLAPSGTTA